MNLTLILNSRERANLLYNFLDSVISTANNPDKIEIYICIDNDDISMTEDIEKIESSYPNTFIGIIDPTTKNLNENFNLVYPHTRGKYIMVANDDMLFKNKGWDTNAYNTLEEYLEDKSDGIVYGQTLDNSVDKSGEYSSFPIISRKAVDILKYVMNPEYVSHGADVELYRIFKELDRVCPVNVVIDHVFHNSLEQVYNPDTVQQKIRDNRNLNVVDCFESDITLDVNSLKVEIKKHKKREDRRNKLAVIYNICGISGREDINYYVHVIQSIYNQQKESNTDYLYAVGACKVSKEIINSLKHYFPSLFIVAIDDIVPINVSFNLTVQKVVENYGSFDGYLYLDYGVNLNPDTDLLNKLHSKFMSGPYGMLSTRTDNDNGYHLWYGLGKYHGDESENDKLFENGDFIVPVGKCVNLHAQIFSHKLYEAYNRKVMPDIFAAYCTESVFSFLNSALRLKWIIDKDTILHHQQIPGNGASGFGSGYDGLDRMFIDQTPVLERIKPGIPYGMGYDESRRLVMHDKSQYDEEDLCTNEKLKEYIRDYMFLPETTINYEDIKYRIYG